LSKGGDSFHSLNLQKSEQAQQVVDGHLRGLGHRDNLGGFLRIAADAPINQPGAVQGKFPTCKDDSA
jgi:hypothetical protein